MKKFIILIPLYNDWKSVSKLLNEIDTQIYNWNAEVSVIIVNDASTEEKSDLYLNYKKIKSIKILNMKENTMHQRCIAAGLKYICKNEEFDRVIVMDADGEDRPEELSLLIEKIRNYPDLAVTANRIKRSEGLMFKFCYLAHKYLTFVFTGQTIKFGNYTCLPKTTVNQMINEPATWSSFSGSLAKTVKDKESIPSERGKRYFGPSKMSFMNLLKHSLSIIAVFKTTLLIRSILFLIVYLFLMIGKISVITIIPVIAVIVMMLSVFILSKRENMSEYNSSLENIENIDRIK